MMLQSLTRKQYRVAVLVLMVCSSSSLIVRPTAADLRSDVERQVRMPRSRTPQEVKATMEEWGNDAVPILLELLADPEFRQRGATIARFLGASGDESAVKPLMDEIEKLMSEDIITHEELKLMSWAAYALGRLGTKEALDYLAKLAGAQYWEARSGPKKIATKDEFLSISMPGSWRRVPISALGRSSNPEAIALLERLEKELEIPALVKDAVGARKNVERRLRGEDPDRPVTGPMAPVPLGDTGAYRSAR